jgi:hypothetical protein
MKFLNDVHYQYIICACSNVWAGQVTSYVSSYVNISHCLPLKYRLLNFCGNGVCIHLKMANQKSVLVQTGDFSSIYMQPFYFRKGKRTSKADQRIKKKNIRQMHRLIHELMGYTNWFVYKHLFFFHFAFNFLYHAFYLCIARLCFHSLLLDRSRFMSDSRISRSHFLAYV